MAGTLRVLTGLLAFGAMSMASAQTSPGGGSAPPLPPQPSAAELAAYDAMPDSVGDGAYPAVKLVEPGLPDHVVYRPRDLAAIAPHTLGIVAWGNGGCSDDAASARLHLAEIASHGYIVVAPGRILSGPGAPPRVTPPPQPGALGIKTTTADVAAGIDWALAENKRPGSPYFSKIDPTMIAVSGHSCGGLQALQIAADPRIRAVVIHNSGVFKDGSSPISGIRVEKTALRALHTPVLYVMGGPSDIAFANGSDDFEKIDRVPVALVSAPVGHGGTFHQPDGGRAAAIAAAWLDWQLRHDAAAGKLFSGADCTLCGGGEWTIRKKRLQ